MKSEVRELLTEELKDAYSAEKQALRCMQRALRKPQFPKGTLDTRTHAARIVGQQPYPSCPGSKEGAGASNQVPNRGFSRDPERLGKPTPRGRSLRR